MSVELRKCRAAAAVCQLCDFGQAIQCLHFNFLLYNMKLGPRKPSYRRLSTWSASAVLEVLGQALC